MRNIALIRHPIDTSSPTFAAEEGAEVQFLGVVRGSEEGRPIIGIDYTAYEPMALKMLHQVAEKAEQQFGQHDLLLHHRLGFVKAEDPSIIIRVRTRHSAAAFTICQWYLSEVKKTVPIWKRCLE
ncbi:MAG: molybdenum cofactor biosynthesis protein MoaE [Verrucomicrobiaceae bacterium]|nr:molybdenum cofactor biosynthesis protein MoaE [Verrucomicrobiaceae bacterium]